MSNVWSGDELVGQITSGGWGYRVDASIAHAMVRADLAQEGSMLEVEIYGKRHAASVQSGAPLWDPDNSRIIA